jgi:putative membrane protein
MSLHPGILCGALLVLCGCHSDRHSEDVGVLEKYDDPGSTPSMGTPRFASADRNTPGILERYEDDSCHGVALDPVEAIARRREAASHFSARDLDFVNAAGIGGLFEVESSQLALERASSGKVHDFATMMIADHGAINAEFQSVVQGQGAHVPSSLDAQHEREMEELRHLSGPAFDRKYLDLQRDAHNGAIKAFESAASDCDNPQLRSFASKTLPILRSHRSHIDSVQVSAGD